MEDIIEVTLSDSEIARFKYLYDESKQEGGDKEIIARFQYAHALIRSIHSQDIRHGIKILEELYFSNTSARRDYLYYIAIGHTRLKQYDLALDCVEQFLKFEPENRQAEQLRSYIKEKLTKDGLLGMAIAGGTVLALGAVIGLGLSLASKR